MRSSAPYTVNKSAVVGLTRAMAVDHAEDNIRVNCIMPGLMWTPRLESSSPDAREMRQTSTPLPVEGQGWDIGYAALYLASDEARFVTGITLPVDGGLPPNQRPELMAPAAASTRTPESVPLIRTSFASWLPCPLIDS